MKLEITNKLKLTDMSSSFVDYLCDRLTIVNPKYLENERVGRWNGDTPRELKYYEITDDDGIIVPRGFAGQLIRQAKNRDMQLDIEDHRCALGEVEFSLCGQLRDYQAEAVEVMLNKDFGTLAAPTGSGKTVMALAIIAERQQPALIVVHTKELLSQWIDRIESFLGIPADEIGIIGAGKMRIGDRITVALVQSLYKCSDRVSPHIGHLVVDECHRAPSRTFTEAVTAFDSKYMLGLSATPWRRDRLSKLIFWHLGDVYHQVDKADLQEAGHVLKADFNIRETAFESYFDPSVEYSKMLSELTEDPERNSLICSDVATEVGNGSGICLVLSDRKTHCEEIKAMLQDDFDIEADILTGDLPKAERENIVGRLNSGKIKVLVATGQLIGEGFDCRGLTTLFLATPIRFSGRVIQYLGRVLRPAPGKGRAKVFDYVDVNVGPLAASAKGRQRVFRDNQ